MVQNIKNFFDEIEKELFEKGSRTKDINSKIEDFDINFLNKDDDVKDNTILFEKEGEDDIIDKKDFDEDTKEDNVVLNDILEDLNKNILISVKEEEEEEKNQKACQEILEILRYPKSHKNLRDAISPFKPLTQPKKISMVGKVFYNSAYYDENKTSENTTNINSNNNIENKEH
jgi:hypothetical protein